MPIAFPTNATPDQFRVMINQEHAEHGEEAAQVLKLLVIELEKRTNVSFMLCWPVIDLDTRRMYKQMCILCFIVPVRGECMNTRNVICMVCTLCGFVVVCVLCGLCVCIRVVCVVCA